MTPKSAICNICCENTIKKVVCPVCVKDACTACVRRYLLSQSAEAQCMHCHAVWDRDVLIQILPKTFINGDYKRHREQMLYDQCRAMLPAMQQRAQNVKAARALEAINREMKPKLSELYTEHTRIYNAIHTTIYDLKVKDLTPTDQQQSKIQLEEMNQLRQQIFRDIQLQQRTVNENARMIQYIYETGDMPEATPREPPRFIRGCPVADCRGFMGETDNKLVCGVCSLEACVMCHESLATTVPHVCRKENIETAKLLKKDTRPCPKCSVPIFKINGCDQMWCVLCQTTFSWNTGEISVGRVHNPHYYEWMRQTNRVIPREPEDCDGRVNIGVLRDWLLKIPMPSSSQVRTYQQLLHTDLTEIAMIHRQLEHITHVELPRFEPETQRERLFQKPLILFLLNELSEDTLKRKLQQKEKRNQQKRGMYQILQMLVAASRDVFQTTLDAHPEPTMEHAMDLKNQLNTIRDFANEALFRHKAIYAYTPWVISDYWQLISYNKHTQKNKQE